MSESNTTDGNEVQKAQAFDFYYEGVDYDTR